MKDSTKGLLMVIISGIVFGAMPGAVTLCYGQGAVPELMVFFRYAMLTLVLIPFIVKEKSTWKIYKAHFFEFLLLSLVGVVTPLLLYTAYHHMATGLVTTVHFLYPAIVVLLSVVFLKEKMSVLRIVALVLSLAGIVVMADFSGEISLVGILVTLASAVTWALYIVLLHRVKVPGISSIQILFFVSINSLVLMGIYGFATGAFLSAIPGVTWLGWILMPVVSLVIAVFGSAFFAFGVRKTDAQLSAIASTLEPIVSILVGIIFLKEGFTARTIIGCVLVLAAVVLLALPEKKAS